MNTPFPVIGNVGPEIDVADLPGCYVTAVETSLAVSAPDLAASTAGGQLAIRLWLPGLVLDGLVENVALTGTAMGTTCGDLLFKDGGASFITATPPYSGTFKPYGDVSVPGGTGSFAGYVGKPASAKWGLLFYRQTGALTVDCWTLRLTVSGTPPAP